MARTTYRLSFPQPHTHLIEVEARFADAAIHGAEVDLRVAAWTPGSYLVREYARHVQDLGVVDETGRPLVARKTDKATWRVALAGGRDLVVRYRVFAHELTVRTSHLDASHVFLNGAPTYLWIPERRAEPAELEVEVPAGWRTVSPLPGGPTRFRAADLDELLDSPLHAGPGPVLELTGAGRPARLAVWGQPDAGAIATLEDLVADAVRVMDTQARIFDAVPFSDYTFFLLLAPGAYGGLEHRRSAALLASPFDFATRKAYEGLVELVSHELFHAWNVKRIRPRALAELAYEREAYTRSLWVMEGVTSYYDGHVLRRAGIQDSRRYLERIAEDWGKLMAVPGRARQSLEEASFDAWIKLYRPDEHTVNSTVSYYLKGGLAALCLDLEVRRRTGGERSLDDVLRRLWARYGEPDRGFEDDDVQAECEAATGLELGGFFDRVVRGREDPPLPDALAGVGLRLQESWAPEEGVLEGAAPPWLGVNGRSEAGRVRVLSVVAGGPAERDGLYAGDEILAVDGYRVDEKAALDRRLATRRPGTTVRLAIFRRDELREVRVVLGERPRDRFEIVPVEAPSPEQLALRRAWLAEPAPDSAGAPGPAARSM